ncbi:hypothetical protein [Desulfogranum mediterraneum]|uniref:hypothetical protein n=1 Tax=Desulfogranum mediterraneum TaxID=160661 RepID=UPI00041E4CC8|nr:hypothetical protein [Desulfogranum mediterraneum]
MNQDSSSPDEDIAQGVTTVSYVADACGRQQLTPGSFWQPVEVVNRQAWLVIEQQVARSKAQVAAGRRSRLHYYMTANQMNPGLLARYTGQPRWRVLLHLCPFFFQRMAAQTITRYAQLFQISPEELMSGLLKPAIPSRQDNSHHAD